MFQQNISIKLEYLFSAKLNSFTANGYLRMMERHHQTGNYPWKSVTIKLLYFHRYFSSILELVERIIWRIAAEMFRFFPRLLGSGNSTIQEILFLQKMRFDIFSCDFVLYKRKIWKLETWKFDLCFVLYVWIIFESKPINFQHYIFYNQITSL